nr:uncharacterized protein LOC113720405 [Coffea arabica]XP_027117500.1 uncharacterized protein LOC113734925 [Coffea arabica]
MEESFCESKTKAAENRAAEAAALARSHHPPLRRRPPPSAHLCRGNMCGMDNGNETPAANRNGHANGHVESPRPIYYRALGRGVRVRYSPSDRYPCCSCRLIFVYPNHLVLVLDDERRQLVNTNLDLQAKVDELRQIVSAQGERITELEEVLESEVATAAVTREELQRTRARLTRLGEEVRDRVSEILADATKMIDGVMDIIQSPNQEEDPEKELKEEIPPSHPTMD